MFLRKEIDKRRKDFTGKSCKRLVFFFITQFLVTPVPGNFAELESKVLSTTVPNFKSKQSVYKYKRRQAIENGLSIDEISNFLKIVTY